MLFSRISIVRIVRMQIYRKRVFLLFSTNSINDIDKNKIFCKEMKWAIFFFWLRIVEIILNTDENMAWTKDFVCLFVFLFGQIILGEIEITKI